MGPDAGRQTSSSLLAANLRQTSGTPEGSGRSPAEEAGYQRMGVRGGASGVHSICGFWNMGGDGEGMLGAMMSTAIKPLHSLAGVTSGGGPAPRGGRPAL